MGPPRPLAEKKDERARQRQRRRNGQRPGHHVVLGIDDVQPERHRDLGEIGEHVRRDQSQARRPGHPRMHARARHVGAQIERGERRRQREQRQLFPHQRLPRRPGRRAGRGGRAPQRPKVQRQQHERRRHQHGFGHQPRQQQQKHESQAAGGGLFGMARMRQQQQHEEQAAEHVLARRDPRHGLHARGVPREQRRDEKAASARARRPEQKPEQQRRVRRMQPDVRQMVALRPRAEQRGVHHVGNPQQRQPPLRMHRRESLPHALPPQAARHDRIVHDVLGIVQMQIVEPRRRPKQRPRGAEQQERQQDFRAHVERQSAENARSRHGRRSALPRRYRDRPQCGPNGQ